MGGPLRHNNNNVLTRMKEDVSVENLRMRKIMDDGKRIKNLSNVKNIRYFPKTFINGQC